LPYRAASDLPAAVRRLPPHAQEIFLAAFNSAWRSYAGSAPGDEEAIAFRVAWAAVKKRYRKRGGVWVAREELFDAD
jgi:cation transport regulator